MPVITPQDVIAKYQQYAGRAPTQAEINQHAGQSVADIDAAARAFFGVGGGGGGGGGEEGPMFEMPNLDFGALFQNLGPSPQELALIKEQTDALRQQRSLLERQLQMADVFAQFQAEQGGYEYVRAPSTWAERQKMGEELGLGTLKVPKDYADRQRLGAKLGMEGITVPKGKAERATLAQQLGIKPGQLPPAGKVVYDIRSDTKLYDLPEAGQLVELRAGELGQMRNQLEKELTQQSLKALRGELPVSPTLERSFRERDQLVAEGIRRNLGPGGETSSPGIEERAAERQFQTEAIEAARRGELSMASQLGLAQGGARLANTGAVAGTQAPYFGVSSGFGNVAGGFGQAAAGSIAGRQASIGGAGTLGGLMLGQAGLGAQIQLGGMDFGLRNQALDLQRLIALNNSNLGNRQLDSQNAAAQAARDAALWNAIGSGVGLGAGVLAGRF